MADLIGSWDPTNCIFGVFPENLKLARNNTDQEHVDLVNFNIQNMPCFQGESAPSFISLAPSGTATGYWYNDGKLIFDGADDNGSLSHIINFTDISTQMFEINVSDRTLGLATVLMGSYINSDNYWHIYVNTDDTIWFTIRNGSVTSEVKTSTTIGSSSKITCRKDGEGLDIWLDGTEASYSTQDTYTSGTSAFTRTDIGEWITAPSSYNFSGNIEKIVYYDDAISDARIVTNAGLDSSLGLTVADRQLNEMLTVRESSRSIGSRTIQTSLSGTIDATGWLITTSADTEWGVGDEISIDTGGTPEAGFVYSRSGNVFRLQSKTTKTGTLTCSIKRSYSTQQLWNSGTAGDLPTLGIISKGVLYADSTYLGNVQLSISGSTVDYTHFKWLDVALGNRHDGTAFGGGVLFDLEGAARTYFMRIYNSYSVVKHLRFTDGNVTIGILLNSGASDCILTNNILHDFIVTNSITVISASSSSTENSYIENNIIYNITNTATTGVVVGIITSVVIDSVCNNTVYNLRLTDVLNINYIRGFSGGIARNNISANVTTAGSGLAECYSNLDTSSDYNIATDTTTIGANSIDNAVTTDLFKDLTIGTEDLNLKEGSIAIGTGDRLTDFTVDAASRNRYALWDIGALQTTVINKRSIGTASAYSTGTVSTSNLTVTLSGGIFPNTSGVGDVITINSLDYFVESRDSDTQITLQDWQIIPVYVGETYSLARSYSVMQSWESAQQGNLILRNTIEKGICYNDSVFTSVVTIDGSTTDSTHYLLLEAADGQKHTGVAKIGGIYTGVAIDIGSSNGYCVSVGDDYTVVAGLIIKSKIDSSWSGGIKVSAHYNMILSNICIGGYFFGISIGVGGYYSHITNNIIYGCTGGGINVIDWTHANIYNNTIFDCNTGILIGSVSIDSLYIKNNVCLGNSTDFVTADPDIIASNNISSDVTAPGSSSLTNKNAVDNFIDIASGSENLNLKLGANAIWTGVDLSSVFTTDAIGLTRIVPWDMGALLFVVKNYTRGISETPPINNDDLLIDYTDQDYIDVVIEDSNTVDQYGANTNVLHQYKDRRHVSSEVGFILNWIGQTNFAPSISTVYLQVYNHNSSLWETVDSDNVTIIDTDFTLTSTISSNLSNYYENGFITSRIYQDMSVGSGFSASFDSGFN